MKKMDTSEEINDESDHDEDSPRGYFTRAKRRKLSEKYEGREEPSTSSGLYRIPEIAKRKNPIMHVPTEVLFSIFRHISYHELTNQLLKIQWNQIPSWSKILQNPPVSLSSPKITILIGQNLPKFTKYVKSTNYAWKSSRERDAFSFTSYKLGTKVRLVNRRFKSVAENMLNMSFKKIKSTMDGLVRSTTNSLDFTTDDTETKCLSKMLCFLEILSYQYALIIVTIWRYVYNDYYRTNRACMYGGMIIDMHDQFIRKFSCCPNELYGPAIIREYSLPHEVTKIIQLTKSFCVHFDKVNEESMQNSLVFSGCKIIDILNCAAYAQKSVDYEMKTEDTFTAKYRFYFKNSWFIQMPIPQTKEMDWCQKQRLMHMRLRRIVFAHNEMYLQQEQYERELTLRPNAPTPIKKPGNNVYTGYGDVEDTFFYYGVMNDGAYIQKFHLDDDNEDDDEEDDLIQVQIQEPNAELNRENSEEDVFYGLPYNGFRVDIDIKCPLSYSPLKFLKTLSNEETIALKTKAATKGVTFIEMHFDCYGAHYPRLPCKYDYHFQSKRS